MNTLQLAVVMALFWAWFAALWIYPIVRTVTFWCALIVLASIGATALSGTVRMWRARRTNRWGHQK